MKQWMRVISVLIAVQLFLSACVTTSPTEEVPQVIPTEEKLITEDEIVHPVEDVLYLNLIWHQHQPLYYKDENGIYTRPWVRVHATKDYYDMASILEQYPEVKITFNLTPVLIKQLDDFVENGAIDLYWQYSLIPANELTQSEKEFILTRFFDANWDNIIARFPRYQELLKKRGGTSNQEIKTALEKFNTEDFRDLQIWFNLAWFDPDFLESEPLSGLVRKQRGFTEEDKLILFDEAKRVMEGVIPIHKKLQDEGQIEVITTPYAHPILPLLIDSNIARIGNPSTDLPSQFSYPQDAISHLEISKQIYQEHFSKNPVGLWPGEGSVAQLMVPHVINADYQWMASGESVLAKSLGIESFTRNTDETVNEADQLYRPYYVKNQKGEKLAVFFRDGVISDKIGFTYSGMSGSQAADDLMGRFENIRQQLKSSGLEGPHIVSIIVDGENAWEYYKNDGKEFFHSFYQQLSDSKTIKSITPSEYLELFPIQREIDDLFPGAWFSQNYDTWIGEEEENLAWEYLRLTREILAKYDISKLKSAPKENLAKALDYMYLAEGSDWFWWYGADQDSGQDSYFDESFRALLRNVFTSIGEPVPGFVNVPIIQDKAIASNEPVFGLSSPNIDGLVIGDEWDNAGVFIGQDGSVLERLQFCYDSKNIYFLIDINKFDEDSKIGIYFKSNKGSQIGFPYTFSQGINTRLLGISATHLYEWGDNSINAYKPNQSGWQKQKESESTSQKNEFLEILIPINEIGDFDAGDEMQFIVIEESTKTRIPENGPGQIIFPDLGLADLIMEINDPEGDDFGPGTYTYPTDSVFPPKAYDLKSFKVSHDENNLIFKIEFFGPIPNPWGSPNNLAIQTLDIYIDTDPGTGSGARALLPGRNLSLSENDGWDFAIWAEGWTPQIMRPDPESLEPKEISSADYKIIVDSASRSVTIRVDKSLFESSNYEEWGYAVIVMGQEGFPSTGVWRVRDVNQFAEQWRFGGAGNSTNHTRVIDMIWPENELTSQSDMLSGFVASNESADKLSPDDYAIIKLLIPEKE